MAFIAAVGTQCDIVAVFEFLCCVYIALKCRKLDKSGVRFDTRERYIPSNDIPKAIAQALMTGSIIVQLTP
jgi:hypothetical protein